MRKGKGVINKTISKFPFEIHLAGHNFTGPGTQLLTGKTRLISDLSYKSSSYSQKEVSEFLHKQDLYTLHKPVKRKFETRRVYALYKDNQCVSDLAFMQKDKGFKYILTIIEAFTRYAWEIPIRNKTGNEITNAFREIFKERKPERMQTDKGTKFINCETQNLLKKHNIEWFAAQNVTKASIVERFNRTLKEIKSSNKKYNVGVKVRISKYKGQFDEGYLPNFTNEVFEISKVLSTEPVTYKIKDQNNEDVEGGIYNEELVKYDKEDDFYKVEKIIRSRTRNGKK
ncbi:hypothetical protein LAZ67_2003232 [Cordylochernes scorpioides]|uniref:Integrase catalytic domain-containing protein n=1 Tax=Cordylochernes scorpioides TaxID=51811 RepID=A0ABY6K4B7_9ARAC|nr:hypothetical protein LAZ67_2003232 [Cordylochernes scorpioides]